jgi:DNA repair exonuclease SbcCD ATPase subunit
MDQTEEMCEEKIEECNRKIAMNQEKSARYRETLMKMEQWERVNRENERIRGLEREAAESDVRLVEYRERSNGLLRFAELVKEAETRAIQDFVRVLNKHAAVYLQQFFPDQDLVVTLKTSKGVDGKEKGVLNFEVVLGDVVSDLTVLSGGERDRVNLAFTLGLSELTDNRVLMLDECISSLDLETSHRVIETLKERYARDTGKLLLCVCHQTTTGLFDHVVNL